MGKTGVDWEIEKNTSGTEEPAKAEFRGVLSQVSLRNKNKKADEAASEKRSKRESGDHYEEERSSFRTHRTFKEFGFYSE